MIKLPLSFVGEKVIFKYTNDKKIDKMYKEFYTGGVYDVVWDMAHSAVLCQSITRNESFFLTENWAMNVIILTQEEYPEYYL